MYRVIVIGGGWAGCAAALTARKAGAQVVLLEKTDLLLGLGNVGGIMRNNGRFTATEENIALGASELFAITDKNSRHKNINFPGHRHASIYDVTKVEPEVRRLLKEQGIEIKFMTRVIDVESSSAGNDETIINRLLLADGEMIEGDVFVETTGSTGPMGNCLTYGNGCCMCILRCPAFGPRVSISAKAGSSDVMGKRHDGVFGAFSGSCKLDKRSLSTILQKKLDNEGVVVIPLPQSAIMREKLDMKVCKQYALAEYAENIILLDTGHAKLMSPFFDLEKLREIPGFENARYVDPYAGSKGNSIRYLSVAQRDNTMKVKGICNLFCGGEKSGLFVGHTEAITTGSLAGHNAAKYLKGMKSLQLPVGLAVGDIIKYANDSMKTEEGLTRRCTFAGAEYYKRMIEKRLYTIDVRKISKIVSKYELNNVYNDKFV